MKNRKKNITSTNSAKNVLFTAHYRGREAAARYPSDTKVYVLLNAENRLAVVQPEKREKAFCAWLRRGDCERAKSPDWQVIGPTALGALWQLWRHEGRLLILYEGNGNYVMIEDYGDSHSQGFSAGSEVTR